MSVIAAFSKLLLMLNFFKFSTKCSPKCSSFGLGARPWIQAWSNTCAAVRRFCVSFCNKPRTRSLASSETRFHSESSKSYRPFFTALRISLSLLPSKGGQPQSNKNKITPQLQRSQDGPYIARMTSGAAYMGVPTQVSKTSSGLKRRARPKSINFIGVVSTGPLAVKSKFSGLRSRWQTPSECKYNIARQSCCMRIAACGSVKRPAWHMTSNNSPPLQTSMTKYTL
mmetsp:Transcript_148850/g.370897  ORF Transcript_148850/g.370897 Transcript_148850/m.370897 type:complete len:226 (+) Transcript_148850:67-744(+)